MPNNSDTKKLIKDIVDLFYQNRYKIFNVNTINGKTLIKPIGYFISLGITTPISYLMKLKTIIDNSNYGLSAELVELRSSRSESYGDYLNLVTKVGEENIKKYKSNDNLDSFDALMTKEGAESLLNKLDSLQMKLKLSDVMKKIDGLEGGWDDHLIYKKDGVFGVYYSFVNYLKDCDNEYRIGIYVKKL